MRKREAARSHCSLPPPKTCCSLLMTNLRLRTHNNGNIAPINALGGDRGVPQSHQQMLMSSCLEGK